jgi:phospholipid/cholesterol/gamma-HCH transport system ATP-binding protein
MTAAVEDDDVVRVQDLTVGFGRNVVLNNLSLEIKPGEILGLVGGSGSGKTVLLRTIIGLIAKRSGSIKIRGKQLDLLDDEERQKVERCWGILFQQGALFSSLTVKENVQFPMRENLKLPVEVMDKIALTKLAMVGLSRADAEKMPSELSGGMTKRAALARAVALDPQILFLDEPTSGLDPISAGEFDTLIKTCRPRLVSPC